MMSSLTKSVANPSSGSGQLSHHQEFTPLLQPANTLHLISKPLWKQM
jgi:hypothetical protein